jgi:hypothetical protein
VGIHAQVENSIDSKINLSSRLFLIERGYCCINYGGFGDQQGDILSGGEIKRASKHRH